MLGVRRIREKWEIESWRRWKNVGRVDEQEARKIEIQKFIAI